MLTNKEERLVDIIGWMWLFAVILVRVFGGMLSLAVATALGVAWAAAQFIYMYKRYPHLLRRKDP
jgi:hypothetical protein